jgi:putative component of membrane protein insertase Oxa1/YidC/SpoIIIJ protein YidD
MLEEVLPKKRDGFQEKKSKTIETLLIQAIRGYQRYISPYKGFHCAYRKATGGFSCSQYAKHVLEEHRFYEAIPKIRQQFRACREAQIFLNEEENEENEEEKKETRKKKREEYKSEAQGCLAYGCADLGLESLFLLAFGGLDGCACTPF